MTSSTRSLLKLAYLFANHGVWDGKQLISRWLADMAGACLVPSLQDPEPPMVAYDTKFGYGFQIWRNSVGGFRIDGGRGQFGIAIPDLDLVIAINATEQDQQILPLLVWKHITNHMYAKPIKEDPETYERLTKKLENLTWAEAGEKLPIPALAGEYVLDKEMIGTKRITVDIASDGTVAVGTDATDELVAFGVCNSGQWSSTSNPFVFEPVRFGSGIGRNSVVGGDLNTTFGCVLCRETGKLEFHIRSKGFMGCKIVEIDSAVGMLRLIPYEDFARQCRSSAVKHPDLDITARDGIQRVKITKL